MQYIAQAYYDGVGDREHDQVVVKLALTRISETCADKGKIGRELKHRRGCVLIHHPILPPPNSCLLPKFPSITAKIPMSD